MNSFEKLLFAPLVSLDNSSFIENLDNISHQERNKLFNTIILNKYSPIYLNYLKSRKISDILTKNEILLLQNQSQRFQIQNLEIIKEVLHIDRIFKKHDLNPIYLKGIALINEFEDISLRAQFDIDILFPEEEIFKAYQALKNSGYKEYRAIEKTLKQLKDYTKTHHHLPELCRSTNIMIEIHHRVTSIDDFEKCPLSESIFNNKVSFDFFGTKIFKPSLDDLLVHLILHFSIQNLFSNNLRIFFDIHQIEKKNNISWEKIYNSNKDAKVKKAILLSLGILNKNFPISNNFYHLKEKFSENFPSDEIIRNCFNQALGQERTEIPIRKFSKIVKNDSFKSFFNEILRSLFLSKDLVISQTKSSNDLNFYYSSLILFFKRLYLYFFSVIRLIFKTGKVYDDYKKIKKIQNWID